MDIIFNCRHCDQELSVDSAAAGTEIPCPSCGGQLVIPAAAAGVTDSVRDIFMYEPMEAAEILTLSAGTNNILVIAISGDEIVLG